MEVSVYGYGHGSEGRDVHSKQFNDVQDNTLFKELNSYCM